MRRTIRSLVLVVSLAGLLALPSPARADHHLVMVSEVFMGTPGNLGAQYVKLKAYSGGQDEFFENGARISFYEANGNLHDSIDFTADPEPFANQDSVLVATTAAETFFGVTADLEFPATTGLHSGGAVCFDSDGDGRIDCATWGNYAPGASGSPPLNPPASGPFAPSEGIALGAAMRRVEGSNGLDGGDDTDNSNADFSLRTPVPIGTAGGGNVEVRRLVIWTGSNITVNEDGGPVDVTSGHFTSSDPNSYTAQFSTVPITASEGAMGEADYDEVDETMEYPADDGRDSTSIPINDDSEFEGPERFRMQLRNPIGGAVLGDSMQFTVTIVDPEDDSEKPRSKITRPAHRDSYRPGSLTKIKGTWTDGLGEVDSVRVGIRQTLQNGKCRWLAGDRFQLRSCSKKKLLLEHANPDGTWDYELEPLQRSKGTKIRFYTVFSKAVDTGGNGETSFQTGRNANRFEIK